MRVWAVAKHLLLATALVAGLALAACEASDSGTDTGGGGGKDVSGGGDTNIPTGCQPMCAGRECGPDGCGNNCGVCPAGEECTAQYQCEAPQGGDCIDWFECANACDPQSPDLQQCFTECDNELSEEGLLAKNSFMACQQNDCGHCTTNECLNECIFAECRTEYAACYGSAGHGAGTCDAYLSCQNGCPDPQTDREGFDACDRGCMTATSQEALTAAYGILFCLAANCDEANWNQCVNEATSEGGVCAAEAVACLGDQTGDWCDPATEDCLTCGEMIQCLNGCGGQQECANNCFMSAAESTYYDEYEPIIDCLIENCPNGDIQNCDQNALLSGTGACADKWNACTGGATGPEACDPADHPGEPDYCLSCSGVITCVNGCTTAACQDECVARANEAGLAIFMTFIECLYTECPNPNDPNAAQCQQTAQQGPCSDELQACVANAKSVKAVRLLVTPKAKPAKLVVRRTDGVKVLRAPLQAL